MAHLNQFKFCERTSALFPQFFNDVKVLDIGSMDINGNNRIHFKNSMYTGIDIGEGPNVDLICSGHLFSAVQNSEKFNTVISTECFEHDCYYKETIENVLNNLLLPGGMFIFTCATEGRPEHGTTRTSPYDSPFTNDYYKNLTEEDIGEAIDIEKYFSDYSFSVSDETFDLYFWGIKRREIVDAVILTNTKDENYFRMTKETILSLKGSSNIADFNILVVESNTSSFHKESYEKLGCSVILNNKKFSFSDSINYGLNHCKSRLVCLLNNDIILTRKWFDNIYLNTGRDNMICVYSTLDPYLGLEFRENSLIEGYKPHNTHSGWCHVIDTSILGENKYLSDDFDVWFMDDDFCMRLQSLGLKQVLVRDSVVYHKSASSRSLIKDNEQKTNSDRFKFFEKYKNDVRIHHCLFYDDCTKIEFESFSERDLNVKISGDAIYENKLKVSPGALYFISFGRADQITIKMEDAVNGFVILEKDLKKYL
jgi:hypothetical protein